jgi:phospholipid/cholesterol/gamma-HCH transport system substrate-binding protein
VGEVESGQGTLHELVYGQEGKRALGQIADAARSIDEVVREVEQGSGVLHSLVYEEGNTNFLRELNELSTTLNGIVQDISRGRGTVGGLVRDPTVYEDLKTVLGNVKRNVLFKALIRFTMDKDDLRRMDRAPSASEVAPAGASGSREASHPEPPAR